jgi:hypothetical protein
MELLSSLGYLCGIEDELARKIASELKDIDFFNLSYSTMKEIEKILMESGLNLSAPKVNDICEIIFSNVKKKEEEEEEEEDMTGKV